MPKHVWPPKSSLFDWCERFLGPGTVGRGVLWLSTVAQHKHRSPMWTWSIIICIMPSLDNQEIQQCVHDKNNTATKKPVKLVMFSVLLCLMLQPCYNAMTYVQEASVLRPGCSQSNRSAGQNQTATVWQGLVRVSLNLFWEQWYMFIWEIVTAAFSDVSQRYEGMRWRNAFSKAFSLASHKPNPNW